MGSEMCIRDSVPTVDYDADFDQCQEEEDTWVSDILGTEDDAIYDVLDQL